MENIIELDLDPTFHISQLPTTYVKKFILYIPPMEEYIPNENHYFGLTDMSYGNVILDQENRSLSMTVRHFFKELINNKTYAYEIAATPQPFINDYSKQGVDLFEFAKDNLITDQIIDNYYLNFNKAKANGNHSKTFRIGTIIRRLGKNLRTTDMTDEEFNFYNLLENDELSDKEIALTLNNMTIEIQTLMKNCRDLFHPIDMNFINQFLIRLHKEYYGRRTISNS